MDYPFIDKTINSYINDHDDNLNSFTEYNKFIIEIIQDSKINDYRVYEYVHCDLDRREQQKLIYSLLDEKLERVNESVLSAVLLTGLAGAVSLVGGKIIWRKLVTKLQNIADTIHSLNLKSLIEKKILYQNFNNCLDKCGVSNDTNYQNISLRKSLFRDRTKISDTPSLFETEKSKKDSDCLLNCYLDFISSAIAVLSNNYKECLVNTGVDPRELNDDKILIYRPMSVECYTFYQKLQSINNDFSDVINMVYGSNIKAKHSWVAILHHKIKEVSTGNLIKPTPRNQFINIGKKRF